MGRYEEWLQEGECHSRQVRSARRRRTVRWVGVVGVGLVAAFVGFLLSPLAVVLYRRLDEATLGGIRVKGLMPLLHAGTPFGFELKDMPDLRRQTFLVTGANVGLGYWTARHLVAAQADVVLACRDAGRCAAAVESIKEATGRRSGIESLVLDLASFASVRDCARAFGRRWKNRRLDGLILNAGVMVPTFGLTAEGLEMQMGVNHFGHFLLTQLLVDALEKTAARGGGAAKTVTVVSSAAHYTSYAEGILPTLEAMNDNATYDALLAYGQSKLANVLFAQELAQRHAEKKLVLVNAVHPGLVDTALTRHILDKVQAAVGDRAFAWLKRNLLDPTTALAMWPPDVAALTILYAAVSPKVRANNITGRYFHPIARPTEPQAHAQNATLQKFLWALSEDVVNAHP